MSLILDTYALMELFRGTDEGKVVKRLIEEDREVYVSVLSLYELGTVLERQLERDMAVEYVRSVVTHYDIVDISREVAQKAVELKRDLKLPAIDVLIYASARMKNASVVSGCKHFRSISKKKDVIIV